ncbi:hypothetical protein SCP_0704590 [Sparassis crispa]|uniref:HPt domain-containing protein n=1 Tax=Sparassis crispa TaxID=139825 RepID=A0A401GSR8_9APHY|nr:hypothetical protein SCP_0704590 [Sparassis crispa]GBE85272.1 hypothetical protein SCP_0704590 [Sparassis crispa]
MATAPIARASVPPRSPRDPRSPSPPPSVPDPVPAPRHSPTPAPQSRAQSLAPTSTSDDADNEAEQPVTEPATEPATEPDAQSTIDIETFHQILDLDEDDTHDFSRGMAWAYFSQASTTFTEMDEAFSAKDLPKLSSLGHFLKGSSAALGVSKVQASCEQIQHYGQLRDEEHAIDLQPPAALALIGPLLSRVKSEYATAEAWLKKWYEDHGGLGEEDDA